MLRAIDLLNLRSEIKSVVERAFPDKCAASIVPDIEAALQLSIENPSLIYVTNDGEQVVNGRLIVTGAQAGQRGASLLGLKREIKQLRVQTEMLAGEQQAVSERLAQAESQALSRNVAPGPNLRSITGTRRARCFNGIRQPGDSTQWMKPTILDPSRATSRRPRNVKSPA